MEEIKRPKVYPSIYLTVEEKLAEIKRLTNELNAQQNTEE